MKSFIQTNIRNQLRFLLYIRERNQSPIFLLRINQERKYTNMNAQLQRLKKQELTPIPLENDLTTLSFAEQQNLFFKNLCSSNHLHFVIQIFPMRNQWPPKLTTKITSLVLSLLSKKLSTSTIITLSRKEIHLFYNTHVMSKTETNNLKDFIAKNLLNIKSQYNLIIKSHSVSSGAYIDYLPGLKYPNCDSDSTLFSINGMYTPPNASLNTLPDVPEGFKCNARRNLELLQTLPSIPEMGVHSGRHKLLFAFYGIAKNVKSKADATKLAVELNNRLNVPLSNNELLHQLSRVDQHAPNGYRFSDNTLVSKFLPITMEEAQQHGFLNSYIKKQQFENRRCIKEERNKRIIELFHAGNSYSEISNILKKEGFQNCSLATIKRILVSVGARRYNTRKSTVPECVYQKAHFSFKAQAPALTSLLPTEGFDFFDLKKNTWITGLAGAGKTTLLSAICLELKKHKKRILTTAAYGIAAEHAGGDTICHSLAIASSIVWNNNSPLTAKDLKPLLNIDVLVIDEIGTCRPDIFSRIVQLIEKIRQDYQHHIQLIVVGDFLQIQSFYSNEDIAYANKHSISLKNELWETEAWNRTIEQVVFLEGSCRTDDNNFHMALSHLAMGTNLSEAIDYINQHAQVNRKAKSLLERTNATFLAAHRADIEKVNQKYVDKHKNDDSFTTLEGTLNHDTPGAIFGIEQTIPIWLGMRIMTIKNGKNYKNGTCGVVTKITKSYLEMNACDEIIKIYKQTFFDENHSPATLVQFPIVPAYGITIHKAQGLTLEKIVLNPNTFVPGQLYTALSRVRSIRDLILTRKIKRSDVLFDQKAVAFMKNPSQNLSCCNSVIRIELSQRTTD